MNRVIKTALGGLMVLAVLTTASACGSSSGSNSSGASAKINSSLTKSTILIGMLNATTGVADGVQAADNVKVAEAWEAWVNSTAQGINGHPVKIEIADTKDDPATGVAAAKKMIADGVVAVVGGSDTVAAGAWVPELNKAKIPVVGGLIFDDSLIADDDYFFPTVIPATSIIKLQVDSVKEAGLNSFLGILCGESPSCKGATQLWEPEAKAQGVDDKGYIQVKADQPDYTAACLNAAKSKADYVQLAISEATTLRVLPDCLKQGVRPAAYGVTYGTVDGKLLEPLSKQGLTFLGQTGAFPWFLDAPGAKSYRDVLTKYEGTYFKNPTQTGAWASFELFRKALANASDKVTSADVYNGLSTIKDDDLGGLLAEKVTFTAGQPHTPMKCTWLVKIAGGTSTAGAPICLSS